MRNRSSWSRRCKPVRVPATAGDASSPSWAAAADPNLCAASLCSCVAVFRCCIRFIYGANVFEFYFLPVELRRFELLTSCMPSAGSTSTHVYPRRSPSRSVCASPAWSAPVAVLPRCTHLGPSSLGRLTVLEGPGQIRCAQPYRRPIKALATLGFYFSADVRKFSTDGIALRAVLPGELGPAG